MEVMWKGIILLCGRGLALGWKGISNSFMGRKTREAVLGEVRRDRDGGSD